MYFISTICYFISFSLDFFDGYFARLLNQTTKFVRVRVRGRAHHFLLQQGHFGVPPVLLHLIFDNLRFEAPYGDTKTYLSHEASCLIDGISRLGNLNSTRNFSYQD